MMKKGLMSVVIFASLALAFSSSKTRKIKNTSFIPGESLTYKMKFGFLTIGTANVNVHSKIFNLNGKPCYRVNITGKTAGLASLWDVKNTYRSYVDTTAFIPHKFEYSARENDYKRDQTFTFNHLKNTVQRLEKDEVSEFKTPANVQDLVSYYYLLRTIDFKKMKLGATTDSPMFFDDESYNIRMKYAGKKSIRTKFGKIETLLLSPVLPDDMLFEGEGAIRIYVSDDDNRTPIRLEIDFPFASIDMELVAYKNVRHPFSWI